MKKIWSFVVFEKKAKDTQINELERKLFSAAQNLFEKDCNVYICTTKRDLDDKHSFKLYLSNHKEMHSDYILIGEYQSCNFYATDSRPLASAIQKLVLKKVEENVKS